MKEELLAMSYEDLKSYLHEREEALTNLKFQQAMQQLEGPHRIRQTRREIAQVNTLLREYDLGIRKEQRK